MIAEFEVKERGMTDFIEEYRAQKSEHFNKGDWVKYNKAHYSEKWGFIVKEVPNPMAGGNRVFDVWWIGENTLQKNVWDYDLKSRFYD